MKHIKCNKYVAFSHFHGFNVNNLGLILLALGILGGSEMLIVASGLFAIGAEIEESNKKGE